MGRIQTMFNPTTVAVIGASEKDGTVGRTTLENLLSSGVRRIYPVNPAREFTLGIKTYPSIDSVPEHVDLAVIATPAPSVPKVTEECGQAGVDGVVIFAAGFKETDEVGKRLEYRIHRASKKYGMRILGPNCVGFVRPAINLSATFLKNTPPPGHIAFISQSAALGSGILDWAAEAGIGFSMFASLGDMVDIDFADMIDFLEEDDKATRSILLYMESVGDARKFMSAARGFARHKPIIVLKTGRVPESAKAVQSHTGSMAGDDAVYAAAFKRAGVLKVEEIAELFQAAEVLDSRKLPRGPKVAIIGSAGLSVITTDSIVRQGGELANLSAESMEKLTAIMPSYWNKANPVYLRGNATLDQYAKALTVCVNDASVDGALVNYVPVNFAPSGEVAQIVVDIARNTWKPIIATWMGGKDVQKGKNIFWENSIPVYDTPEEAARSYMNMYNYKRNLDRLYEIPAELPEQEAPPKGRLRTLLKVALMEGRTLLDEPESKEFLRAYKIPVTMPQVAGNPEAATAIAEKLGYPVVMKIVSTDIAHKSDVGVVISGICTKDELKGAYEKLIQGVKNSMPAATISGVSVEKMVTGVDYEIILGAKKDKDFGSVILFGMGGTTAEFIKDFSIGLPPLNQNLAKMLMQDARVYKMLQGFRGKPAADLEELEAILVNFSNLVVDFPEIAEIDINPLAISNSRACALDARIIIDKNYKPTSKSPHPHLIIAPYPTKYITPWQFSDGTEVLLRPIRPEDEPAESDMLSSLSEETLRTRFFSFIRDIPHEMLTLFCNIDYDRHMAIVAEIEENGKKSMIGVARLIMDQYLTSGEVAVLVHDSFQRRHLGSKLIMVLTEIARERELEVIRAVVLTENENMLNVFKRLGFKIARIPGGSSEAVLMLKEQGPPE